MNRVLIIVLCLFLPVVITGCFANNGQLQHLRGISLYERGVAIQKLEGEYRTSPEDWKAYFLGELAADEARYEDMNTWFDRSEGLSVRFDKQIAFRRAKEWKQYASKGDSLFATHAYEDAKRSYTTALTIDNKRDGSALRLAETNLLLEGPDLATIKLLEKNSSYGALYRWLSSEMASPTSAGNRVRFDLAKDLERQGIQPDAALVLAELARQRSDYTAMVFWYEQAIIAGNPQTTPMNVTRDRIAKSFLSAAHKAYAEADYLAAISMLDTTDILRPGQEESRATRQALGSLTGNHSPAELARLVASEEIDSEWLKIIMVDLYRQERWKDAEMVATRVLVDLPHDDMAMLTSYRAQMKAGQRDSALVWLEELESAGYGDEVTAYNRGVLSMETSRNAEAIDAFNIAMDRGASRKMCLTQLAILSFYDGDFQELMRLSNSLVEVDPEDRDGWRMLSIASQMNNDEETAERCRQKLEVLQ